MKLARTFQLRINMILHQWIYLGAVPRYDAALSLGPTECIIGGGYGLTATFR